MNTPGTNRIISDPCCDEQGRVAVITGADGGMGVEITRAVAKAGYHVVMVCEHEEHGRQVCEHLCAETKGSIEMLVCDLSSMSQVCALANKIVSRYKCVDLLMNNAGTMQERRIITDEGFEKTVAVNYLAPVVLTEHLLPLLHNGSRIVCMVSLSAAWGRLSYPNLFTDGCRGPFWRIPVYSNSKLALSLYILRLARRLKSKGVTVNGADPGIVSTPIISMNMWFDPITDLCFRPFIRTPHKGADTAIHLLLSPDVAMQTGGIYHSRKQKHLNAAYNIQAQEELWSHTAMQLTRWINIEKP